MEYKLIGDFFSTRYLGNILSRIFVDDDACLYYVSEIEGEFNLVKQALGALPEYYKLFSRERSKDESLIIPSLFTSENKLHLGIIQTKLQNNHTLLDKFYSFSFNKTTLRIDYSVSKEFDDQINNKPLLIDVNFSSHIAWLYSGGRINLCVQNCSSRIRDGFSTCFDISHYQIDRQSTDLITLSNKVSIDVGFWQTFGVFKKNGEGYICFIDHEKNQRNNSRSVSLKLPSDKSVFVLQSLNDQSKSIKKVPNFSIGGMFRFVDPVLRMSDLKKEEAKSKKDINAQKIEIMNAFFSGEMPENAYPKKTDHYIQFK